MWFELSKYNFAQNFEEAPFCGGGKLMEGLDEVKKLINYYE